MLKCSRTKDESISDSDSWRGGEGGGAGAGAWGRRCIKSFDDQRFAHFRFCSRSSQEVDGTFDASLAGIFSSLKPGLSGTGCG